MQLGQQGLRWCATSIKRSPRNSPNSGTARVWQQQQQQLLGPLPHELSASVLRTLAGSVALYAGDHRMEKLDAGAKPMSLFMAVPGELEARLPHLPPMRYTKVCTILLFQLHVALHKPPLQFDSPRLITHLACLQMLALGTLSAPVGTVTIVFASVVGAAQLLTDIPEAAREALSVFQVGVEVVGAAQLLTNIPEAAL